MSDLDGNFKLKVAAGKKLVISYIGYETQEVVAKSNMNIVMKDNAKELSEVVVTGYQVQRKADLTGAVAVMDMKSVKSESDPNMLNSMQGKLPGVNIVTDAAPGGGGASIRVRGMSTVNPNVSPLYIIDGVATTVVSAQAMTVVSPTPPCASTLHSPYVMLTATSPTQCHWQAQTSRTLYRCSTTDATIPASRTNWRSSQTTVSTT